nr:hypothetical protein [Aristaeella lactis]
MRQFLTLRLSALSLARRADCRNKQILFRLLKGGNGRNSFDRGIQFVAGKAVVPAEESRSPACSSQNSSESSCWLLISASSFTIIQGSSAQRWQADGNKLLRAGDVHFRVPERDVLDAGVMKSLSASSVDTSTAYSHFFSCRSLSVP